MSSSYSGTQNKTKTSLSHFIFEDRKVINIVLILIAIDLFFIIVHGFKFVFKEDFKALFGPWVYDQFKINRDWSFPEIFNYLKFLLITYLLYRTFAVIRQPVYMAWAFVYMVALLDDSLQGHEIFGDYFSNMIGSITLFGIELDKEEGFRTQDVGELIAFATYGAVFAMVLAFGFLRSQALHRRIGLGFAILLGVLAFFGVVVDMLDRLIVSRTLGKLASTVEDGGEMLAVSLTVALALIVYRRYGTKASRSNPAP